MNRATLANSLRIAAGFALMTTGVLLAAPQVMKHQKRTALMQGGEAQWQAIIDSNDSGEGLPVARLLIRKIGLAHNIMPTLDEESLDLLPGMIEQESANGVLHTVIVAHRNTHFRPLEALELEMGIELRPKDQPVRQYRVEDMEIHSPESITRRIDQLGESSHEPLLMLVTCYPIRNFGPAPQRLLVVCQRSD